METFSVDDVSFVQDIRPMQSREKSTNDRFVMNKPLEVIEFYKAWPFTKPKNILLSGIGDGAPVVFFDKLFRPERLLALDSRRDESPLLQSYNVSRGYLTVEYGLPLPSNTAVNAVRPHFKGGIDLFVDNATHKYDRTKATFEMIFPLLKPGAHYVIEGWAWSLMPGQQKPDAPWASHDAMINLVFELTMLAGLHGVVQGLHVQKGLVCLTKGRGVLPKTGLDFSNSLRGKQLIKL